ncbi:MAG: hypothetical protein ACP5MD_07465 [Verrucomicrobiia bacterium]
MAAVATPEAGAATGHEAAVGLRAGRWTASGPEESEPKSADKAEISDKVPGTLFAARWDSEPYRA